MTEASLPLAPAPAAAAPASTGTTSSGPGDPERSSFAAAADVIILMLAGWLRIRDLGRASLWFDEAVTTWIAAKPLGEIPEAVRMWENTPPLHHYLVAIAIRVLGNSDFVARLPSALAGVGAVWMVLLIGRRSFGWGVGAVAALWYAVSPMQLWYAQEARAYMVMEFLALASCFYFLRLIAGEGRRWDRVAYVVATALLLWSQLYSIFVPLAQNLFYFGLLATRGAVIRLRPTTWVALQLVVALLFAPWLPTTLMWMRRVTGTFWIAPLTADEITRAFWAYVGSGPALLLLACLAAWGVWRATVASREQRDAAVFFLLLGVCPVVIPVIVSLLKQPIFTPRYGMVASAALVLLAARGLVALRSRILTLAVMAAVAVLPLVHVDPPPENDPSANRYGWREAGAYLELALRPGDYVALNTGGSVLMYERYVKRRDVEAEGFVGDAVPVPPTRRPGSAVWLILHTPRALPRNILLSRNWKIVERRAFPEIEIWRLDLAGAEDRLADPTI